MSVVGKRIYQKERKKKKWKNEGMFEGEGHFEEKKRQTKVNV